MELYIFDLDETLIAGDSGMLWHKFLVDKGLITDSRFLAKDTELMRLYALGELQLQQYIQFSLQPIQHLDKAFIDKLVIEFVKRDISQLIYPDAKQLLAQLTAQQKTILIISATVSFIVKAAAELLGVKHCIGVDLVLDDHRYSANIEGIASYRAGKVMRLQEWQTEQREHYTTLYFYSDSINDQAMLEHVDIAYTVNPCPQLSLLAKQKGWPILNWQTHQHRD
ncbi:HAD family hydrolase [Agarivorans sp. MS3-6]